MLITVQGLCLTVWCLWLLYRGTPMQMLKLMIWLGVFQASAALVLSALGGSSISPQRYVVLFLMMQLAVLVRYRGRVLRDAIDDNGWLILFCIWGAVSALLMPRIFNGMIRVVPLKPSGLLVSMLATVPLHPTSQNLTTSVYLLGTGLAAVLTHMVVRLTGTGLPLVRVALAIAVTQTIGAFLNLALPGGVWSVLSALIRNGNYAQLDQQIEGLTRISGFQAEPSIFASYTFFWLVFVFELWLRDVQTRLTGPMALALVMLTVIATSASGYVSLGCYGVVLAMRFCTLPAYLSGRKVVALAIVAAFAVLGVVAIAVLLPQMAAKMEHILEIMTTSKLQSASGQQRSFWAQQSYVNALNSYGLGIGAGSLRSSGVMGAILGSMGVPGMIFMIGYCLKVFLVSRLRLTTSNPVMREEAAIADALALTMLLGMLPGALALPSPDPGMEFAIVGGAALSIRRILRDRSQAPAPRITPEEPAFPRSVGWRHHTT